jgi:hypothetical protein
MRRTGGRETWHRLLEWDKGQSESERLAARLLSGQGYSSVDPGHPLGGPDGGKDIVCTRDGQAHYVSVFFPRGQQPFSQIEKKLKSDLKKIKSKKPVGIVFFTNQELTLGQREKLDKTASPLSLDTFHLERIASCLDCPGGYGLRLEFLSIEMSKEEQVDFINNRDAALDELRAAIIALAPKKQRAQGQLKTVEVEHPDGFSAMTSLFRSKLVECRNCQELFRAQKSPYLAAFSDSLATVKCPECGKVQAFK